MSASNWNPDLYNRYKAERSRPFYDLMELVRPKDGMSIVDLGCGTGELTAELHARLKAGSTVGIDSSDTMLARAKDDRASGLTFALHDIESTDLAEGRYDLVFSNAALHYIDDHIALFARLRRTLAPGGQLAVQMPANFDFPTHTIARQLWAEEPFRPKEFREAKISGILDPAAYAQILYDLGFTEQNVLLRVYPHVMESREDILEWVKGTLLTAYEKAVAPDLFPKFMEEYRKRLWAVLPDVRPIFYPFKRLFLWGAVPGA